VLTGAFVFVADLIRADPGPSTCDFIALSSYGEGRRPSGAVTLTRDLTRDVTDRHVVIVEDIVDTGRTLLFLRETLLARRPRSLRTVALLNKASRREVDVPIEHIGFDIEDRFVVGYGLDIADRYRHLPFIGVVCERRGGDS
jgi:hypoxanthine phosphoribosyltransferase